MVASLYESDYYKGNNYRIRDLDDQLASIMERISVDRSDFFYVVIDGLDELTSTNGVQLLGILGRLWSSMSLNLLITSRSEMDVKTSFADSLVPELPVCEDAVHKDIRCYVEWQLQNDPGLRKIKSQGLRTDIERTLLERSSGMYV